MWPGGSNSDAATQRAEYAVRELDASEATPVLRAYLSMPSERFVRRDFDVTATSDDAALAAEAPRHPVFALVGVDAPHAGEGADEGTDKGVEE